jgi:hypothetical protein
MIDKQPETSGPFEGCILMTFEDTKLWLYAIEQKLAERYGFDKEANFYTQMVALDNAGGVIEDELVMSWHEALSSYMDWLEHPDDNTT